jgi:chloramphenicol 3-O phosphotransferase
MNIDHSTFANLLERLGKVPTTTEPGKLIVLNGTSGAGKTTIARLLREVLYKEALGSYVYFPLDAFEEEGLPKVVAIEPEILVEQLPLVVYGYSSAVAAACAAGVNVIADVVFTELHWAHDFIKKTRDLKVLYVSVQCDMQTVNRREAARPNKLIGLAQYQFERVHREIPYDLIVDTTNIPVQENVSKIVRYIREATF